MFKAAWLEPAQGTRMKSPPISGLFMRVLPTDHPGCVGVDVPPCALQSGNRLMARRQGEKSPAARGFFNVRLYEAEL